MYNEYMNNTHKPKALVTFKCSIIITTNKPFPLFCLFDAVSSLSAYFSNLHYIATARKGVK